MEPGKNKRLVIFDFDDTIIEGNSDLEVNALHPRPIPNEIKHIGTTDHGWIEYKIALFASLHRLGISIDDIKSRVLALPLVAGMSELLDYLKSCSDYEVVVMSGANTLFIQWYLEDRQIDVISKVFANFAEVREGRLVVRCYHHQDWCQLCSKNLCKGRVLEDYIKLKKESGNSYSNVFYVGDGRNDFCPVSKLSENDYVFPRQEYALHNRIVKESTKVKARVVPWISGLEIKSALQTLSDL